MFYPSTDPQLFAQSVQKVKLLDCARLLPAHHSLFVPLELVERIDRAFSDLRERGQLFQGAGIFAFGEFQIHI